MTEDKLSQVKASSIYPDDLMSEISRSTLGKTLIISIVAHVVVIGITSIGFVQLCLKYKTTDPRPIVQAEQKAAEEAKAREEAAAAQAASSQSTTKGEQPAAAANGETPPGEAATENGKSPIEQTLEEKSTDYPAGTDVSFDEVENLE